MTSCAALRRVARSVCARSIASASVLSESRRAASGARAASTRGNRRRESDRRARAKPVSTSSGTATRAYGASSSASFARVRLRISGCRIASSVRRLASSANTSERNTGRLSSPEGSSTATPELGDDGGQAGLAERHDLARDDVRVDESGAELHEHGTDERLAARDAARQAHDQARAYAFVVRHLTTFARATRDGRRCRRVTYPSGKTKPGRAARGARPTVER